MNKYADDPKPTSRGAMGMFDASPSRCDCMASQPAWVSISIRSPLAFAVINALAYASCLPSASEVTRPGAFPPRVARPTRRTYSTPSRGKSKRITWPTAGKSIPRDARSVQTRTTGTSGVSCPAPMSFSRACFLAGGVRAAWNAATSISLPLLSLRRRAFSTRRQDSMVLQKTSVCGDGSARSSERSASILRWKPTSSIGLPLRVQPFFLSAPAEQSMSF
mmetsp:Transcript_5753/g.17712  ORF Transcript_5753/g.17712 Transcript_5753/m.17712 type:complete len:220 (-) Transcript_5753:1398-2057(-)